MSRAAAIGRTASAAVAAIALVLVVVLAGPASAAKPSPKVKLKLKTADQAALVDGGTARATVSYRGRKPKRMTLSVAAIQGGEKTVIAANEKIRARPGTKAKTSFTINRTGAPLVRSCLKTKLRLTARFTVKRGKTHVVAERKMKRDPARCDGKNPVGVEVDDRRSLRSDRRAGRAVPVPVPERLLHASRRLDTDRPAARPEDRLDADERERDAHRPGRDQHQRRVQPRRADRPPRPGHGHAGGVAQTDPVADHRHGRGVRRQGSRSSSSTPTPASAS